MFPFGPPYGAEGPALDAAALLKLLSDTYYWKILFSQRFGSGSRWRIDSLRDLRNRLAHDQGEDPLFRSRPSVLGYLESMEVLLQAIDSPQATEVRAIKSEINPGPIETLRRLDSGRAPGSKRFWAAGLGTIAISGFLIDYYRSPKV